MSQSQTGAGNILNVIFIGTFIFCNKRNKGKEIPDEPLDVFVPWVPNHVFRAGNWLGETEFLGAARAQPFQPTRREPILYELQGVKSGKPTFPDERNLVVTGRHSTELKPHMLHAQITMPLPNKIATVATTAVKREELAIKPGFLHRFGELEIEYKGQLGTINVFQYSFDRLDDLRLARLSDPKGAHPWIPVIAGEPASANLVIYAAHEVDHAEEVEESFDFTTSVFFDLPLTINKGTTASAQLDDELPSGVTREECEYLTPRVVNRGARLGIWKRDRRDLNRLWDPNAFDSSPSACACAYCC